MPSRGEKVDSLICNNRASHLGGKSFATPAVQSLSNPTFKKNKYPRLRTEKTWNLDIVKGQNEIATHYKLKLPL
jgi:hypothetical protein